MFSFISLFSAYSDFMDNLKNVDNKKPDIVQEEVYNQNDDYHYLRGKYCFASWASHGGFWNDNCSDSEYECNDNLKNGFYSKVNVDKCYKYETTHAYCANYLLSNRFRYSDDLEKPELYEVYAGVCTKTEDECKKFLKYQDNNPNAKKCEYQVVAAKESELPYLSTDKELKDLMDSITSTKCAKYVHAYDQKQAFERLGLDWEKTNKWGAFVDDKDNLRADKKSCRLIEKNSEEYNKYKKR